MYIPSLIRRLAVSGEDSVSAKYANCCPGALLYIGLIHLALLIVPFFTQFVSSISLMLSSSVGSKVVGTLGTIIWYVLSLIVAVLSNSVSTISSVSWSFSHSAASFVLNCTMIPPFLSLQISCISTSIGIGGGALRIAALSLSFRASMLWFKKSLLAESMRICLAFLSESLVVLGSAGLNRGAVVYFLCSVAAGVSRASL